MYRKIYLPTIIFALFLQTVFAQPATDEKEAETSATLEKMAIEILRETSQMIGSLRSPQNRQTAISRTADALWALDEPTARNLFQAAIADIKQTMAQVDGELNYYETSANQMFPGNTLQREARQKMSRIISARSALLNTIAKHDVEMANTILYETSRMVSNADFLKGLERADKSIESTLARRIAEKDVTKALEFGREKLKSGVSTDTVGLLYTIYAKDAEKGAAFGVEVIKKLKDGGTNNRSYYWLAIRLLTGGSSIRENIVRTKSDKKPLFSESELADLAAFVADAAINNKNQNPNIPPPIVEIVKKYAPQKAAQINKINEQRAASKNPANPRIKPTVQTTTDTTAQQQIKAHRDFEDALSKLFQSLRNENLTHGEKLEIIGIARGKISAIADQNFRLSKLVSLAFYADNAGENESAQSILSEAEALVNQQPKKREDFNHNKIIANAYAEINPEKSFAIAENVAYMLNAIIESYATYNEFTNNLNAVENDEILIQSYSKQFTNFFSFSQTAVKNLAETDFQRLKNLPDKFNRTELRIEARLNLADALLRASKLKKGNAVSRQIIR